MVVFPNAKINLGLRVTGKRSDGFHNLETIFFPVRLFDALEITEAKQFSFNPSGILLKDVHADENLCVKAYHLMAKHYKLPPVSIFLHKAIPAGAGLGGGSADAAFCLLLLNKMFSLGIPPENLTEHALTLGSDCPFFIMNTPALGSGRGEQLQPVNINLAGYKILLVNPGIHVNTGKAFSHIKHFSNANSQAVISDLPVKKWKEVLINDFEEIVFHDHPVISIIKEDLYKAGALYASMSGTGSTVYGIFDEAHIPKISFSQDWFQKWV